MGIVYHASTHKNLKVIKPKKTTTVDGRYLGDYVFATSNLIYAAMYLVKLGNATLMNPYDKKPYIIIQNDPEKYIANDKGGAIYQLPSAAFYQTPQLGLEKSELVSNVSVKPIATKSFGSSLEAMDNMGITIYFVSEEVFQKFIETKNDSALLPQIKPYKPEF